MCVLSSRHIKRRVWVGHAPLFVPQCAQAHLVAIVVAGRLRLLWLLIIPLCEAKFKVWGKTNTTGA